MGTPKASIPFGGSTFLGRVSEAAAEVFERVVAVQRRGEAAIERQAIDETIFEEEHEDEAPVFGVVTALRHTDGKCFVLALDYPLITPAVLYDLGSRFELSQASMLVPVRRCVPQTLCAGYSPVLLGRIEARIAAGEYDLHSLARGAELVDVEGVELMNVNTPEELEEAERAYEQQRLLAPR